MLTEKNSLEVLRVVGYVNFVVALCFLFGMKNVSIDWLSLAVVAAVSLSGVLLQFVFWHRVFPQTPAIAGRNYTRPYILTLAVLLLAGALVAALHAISGR